MLPLSLDQGSVARRDLGLITVYAETYEERWNQYEVKCESENYRVIIFLIALLILLWALLDLLLWSVKCEMGQERKMTVRRICAAETV